MSVTCMEIISIIATFKAATDLIKNIKDLSGSPKIDEVTTELQQKILEAQGMAQETYDRDFNFVKENHQLSQKVEALENQIVNLKKMEYR